MTIGRSRSDRPAKRFSLALIIPTKDRPEQIRDLLRSCGRQTVLPQKILIVDGSRSPLAGIDGEFSSLPVQYIRNSKDTSTTIQKNIGLRHLPPEIDLVGFLDDDIVLSDDALKKMLRFWNTAPLAVGGASFRIANDLPTSEGCLRELFQVGSKKIGEVLASGFTSRIAGHPRDVEVQWLPGGASVWRRPLFKEFQFDEAFRGYGYLEDLDFSYRVGKKFRLVAVSDAKVVHYGTPVKSGDPFAFGVTQVLNRHYFVSKNRELSKGLFLWASVGNVLMNLVMSLKTRHLSFLRVFLGNIWGMITLALKNRSMPSPAHEVR